MSPSRPALPPVRRWFPLPLCALGATVVADGLLWDAPLGLGAALLALAVGGVLLVRLAAPPPAWLAVALAALLLVLDPGALAPPLALLLVGGAVLWARGWRPAAPAAALGGVLAALPPAFGRSLADLTRLHRWRGCRGWRPGRWVVPVVGTALFLGLFALANPVLAARLGDLAGWLAALDLPAPLRVLLWLATAGGLWLAARLRARAAAHRPRRPGIEPATDGTVRCLAAFNVAFLVQNACDAAYLWGGAALPAGMTYAGYAHRGAYPLVAAALLAGVFVLACVRPGGAAERSAPARALVTAFLLQTVVLTASAWWRLDLYVGIFGLTRWRVATLAWMGLVAAGLALVGWRILARRANRWLVEANAWCVAVLLVAAAASDVDGLVARHNVGRALAGTATAFDLDYHAGLGVAAMPELERLAAARPSPELHARIQLLRRQLRAELGDWRGWTWRRWRVVQELPAGG